AGPGDIPGARGTPPARRRPAAGGRARNRRRGGSPPALSRAQCTPRWYFVGAGKPTRRTRHMPVKITARPNGPYLVEGDVELYDPAGNKVDTTGKPRIALCRWRFGDQAVLRWHAQRDRISGGRGCGGP